MTGKQKPPRDATRTKKEFATTRVRKREVGTNEHCFYGTNSVLALATVRPTEISRVHYEARHLDRISPLLKSLAMRKRPYRVGSSDELTKIAGSPHHGGLVAFASQPQFTHPEAFAKQYASKNRSVVLALLDVQNPHNIGAIYRSAAHFGADAVAFIGTAPRLSGSLARISEGGIEHVASIQFENYEEFQTDLRGAGYQIYATAPNADRDKVRAKNFFLPDKVVVILGNEEEGLPAEIIDQADERFSIPGTGAVESLNVAAAATSILTLWTLISTP